MILFLLPALLAAQQPDSLDSLGSGSLTIVRGHRPTANGEFVRDPGALESQAVTDAAGLLQGLPGSHVFTNSRGEVLVSIRGSQERQVAVYQDGAPLALPWDQRIDLSLVPSALVSRVELVRGTPSVLHGPWASGGVVNLATRSRARDSARTTASLQVGTGGKIAADAVANRTSGNHSLLVGAGWISRDAIATSDASDSPELPPATESQPSTQSRTNSDLGSRWAMARAVTRPTPGSEFGLSAQIVDGSKGDPPSGFAGDAARFWRIPLWRILRVAADARLRPASWLGANGSVWATQLHQQIDKYASDNYGLRNGREDGLDQDWGARLVANAYRGQSADASFSVQGDYAEHIQTDLAYNPTGKATAGPELTFRQILASTGLEAGWRPVPRVRLEVGGAWDVRTTLEAGDKPAGSDESALGATTNLEWNPVEGISAFVASGSRTRFASPRELYGEALKTFAPNPDLKPETYRSVEGGITWTRSRIQTRSSVFLRQTLELIDQTRIPDPSAPKKPLRKRINLDRTWARGLEGQIALQAFERLALEADALWLDAWADDTLSRSYSPSGHLTKTPELIAHAGAKVKFPASLTGAVGWEYKGQAWDRHPDPARRELVSLGSSQIWALHLGWSGLGQASMPSLEIGLHLENVFDTPSQPQLGLPDPGRTVTASLRLEI